MRAPRACRGNYFAALAARSLAARLDGSGANLSRHGLDLRVHVRAWPATLSHHTMASSFFPPDCSAEARRTMYAGSGRELASTALLNAAAAASYFLRVRFARPIVL